MRQHLVIAAVGFLLVSMGLAACAPAQPEVKPAPARAAVPGRVEFPGFTRVMRKGVEQFCQVRSPTGSRARMGEQCFTRDELRQMEENNRDFWKDAGGGSSHDSLRMDSPR